MRFVGTVDAAEDLVLREREKGLDDGAEGVDMVKKTVTSVCGQKLRRSNICFVSQANAAPKE